MATHARRPSPDERAAELEALDHAARRDERRVLWTGAFVLALSVVTGLFCLAWSMHVNTVETGRLWFWGGLVIGNVGILGAIAWVGTTLGENERP